MFSRLLSNIYHKIPSVGFLGQTSLAITQTRSATGALKGIRWDPLPIRRILRYNWPRPKETKRVKQGWKARMSTLHGRKIIMSKILRGKSILSH